MISRFPNRCKHCREKFTTEELARRLRLHISCIDGYADAQQAKKERADAKAERMAAKVERASIKARKEAIKPRAKWLAECQAIVNKIVRLRDRHLPCCSCDRPASWDGQWHASHFRSVGAASAVRFNLWNIHKACSVCNHHLSGNIAGYMPRLVEKIGPQKVEWLQQQNQIVRYEIEYLKRLKSVFNRRANRVAKRKEIEA